MKILLLLLALSGLATSDITFKVDLEPHLKKLSDERYPIPRHEGARLDVQEYLKERMNNYGLDVKLHNFTTQVNSDPNDIVTDILEVNGTNIIGISPGKMDKTGGVLLIGADYDSNGMNEPLLQNGAGVAALLETARLYTFNKNWSGRYAGNFTTIFVAFDINTKFHKRSPGVPGGHFFVHEWLMNFLNRRVDYFGGAVIFDSIMNVNYKENSQKLTKDFENRFPDTYTRIQEHSSKGDFLAMVSIGSNENEITLKDQFSGAYNRDRRSELYRLEDMQLHSGQNIDEMTQQFIQSENMHFWTYKDENSTSIHLPAILLTDTMSFRDAPPCPSSPCRPVDLVTESNLEFLEATVKATTRFLLKRQATLLPPPENGSPLSSLPSALMTAVMMCLVRLYM